MILINILFLIVFYLSIYIIANNNYGRFYYRVKQCIEFVFYFCASVFTGIMSLSTMWLDVDFEKIGSSEGASLDTVFYTMFLVLFVIVTVPCIIWCFLHLCDFPFFKLIEYYKSINDKNIPKISYSLFKNMFLLHPDYFKFEYSSYDKDYETLIGVYYHDEKISFRFIDYLFMLDFVRRFAEEDEYKRNSKKESKIYELMQEDLEKDRIKVKENTEKALKEIEDASKKSIEIMNRIT